MNDSMLSVEEVKQYLDIEQDELEKFLQRGKLHAYKVGGTYLRFRKEEVKSLRFDIKPKQQKVAFGRTFWSKLGDFWRYNNFYILSLLFVTAAILWLVSTS